MVGSFLLTFLGYKAQNMTEGELALRKQTFPEPEQDLKG